MLDNPAEYPASGKTKQIRPNPSMHQLTEAIAALEELPGLEVEHVVADDPGGLGVQAGGHAGPSGQVIRRVHRNNLIDKTW